MKWANYFFNTNFNDVAELVGTLPRGKIDQEDSIALIAVLNEKDKKEGSGRWCFDEETKSFNLGLAEVVYNGKNSTDFPTHPLYGNVVILEFPSESEAPVGRIYLHYN